MLELVTCGGGVCNRVIAAIDVEIITAEFAGGTEIGNGIGIEEPAGCGVVVAALQVIEPCFGIKIVTAIAERVNVANRTAVIVRNRVVAPCIIGVMCQFGAIRIVNIYDITEKVLAIVVVSTVINKAQDTTVCAVEVFKAVAV